MVNEVLFERDAVRAAHGRAGYFNDDILFMASLLRSAPLRSRPWRIARLSAIRSITLGESELQLIVATPSDTTFGEAGLAGSATRCFAE